jgi:protein-disulfide isomerase
LNLPRFKDCLSGDASAKIAADVAEARRLSVGSTPTFFVGLIDAAGSIQLQKRINGAVRFEEFEAAVAEVAGAKVSLLER